MSTSTVISLGLLRSFSRLHSSASRSLSPASSLPHLKWLDSVTKKTYQGPTTMFLSTKVIDLPLDIGPPPGVDPPPLRTSVPRPGPNFPRPPIPSLIYHHSPRRSMISDYPPPSNPQTLFTRDAIGSLISPPLRGLGFLPLSKKESVGGGARTAESSSMDSASLLPHLASLTSSFATVPPAVVPAIIDYVLASSALSPPQLFSSLLHAFPGFSQVLESNHIVCHATALCHLIKKSGTPASHDALRLLIWRVFVPLLKAIDPNDSELLSQVNGLLGDVISNMQSWELVGATLVPFCLRSVGLSMGMLHSEELTTYQWNSEGIIDQESEGMSSEVWLLSIACYILKSLLDVALRSGREIGSHERKSVDERSSLNGFVRRTGIRRGPELNARGSLSFKLYSHTTFLIYKPLT